MKNYIIINVIGRPPYKQSGHASLKEKRDKINYAENLKTFAKKVMVGKQKLTGNLILNIFYKRCNGKMDSSNIIGGICDTLQKIVYNNDINIRQIIYKEIKYIQDEYAIKIGHTL